MDRHIPHALDPQALADALVAARTGEIRFALQPADIAALVQEVCFWRSDAAAVLERQARRLAAAKATGHVMAAATAAVLVTRASIALGLAIEGRYADQYCEACSLPLLPGQPAWSCENHADIHVACWPEIEPEARDNPDGPPPEPYTVEDEYGPMRVVEIWRAANADHGAA